MITTKRRAFLCNMKRRGSAAKRALRYRPVSFAGTQARAMARGFAIAAAARRQRDDGASCVRSIMAPVVAIIVD